MGYIIALASLFLIFAFMHYFTELNKKELNDKVVYFMSIDKAKFRKPVRPGDKLVYKVSTIKHRGKIWHLKGEAYVDGELVSEAELKAMIMDK